MQCLDAFRKLVRNGRCRLERHSPTRLAARATAIEAEPALGIYQLAMAVDEVGNPQDAVAQIGRRFAELAPSQDLAQDRHGMSSLAMLMTDIFDRAIGEIAKKLLKMPKSVGRPGTSGE
jgi:hypothetical protein